jgi:hypothetical protein
MAEAHHCPLPNSYFGTPGTARAKKPGRGQLMPGREIPISQFIFLSQQAPKNATPYGVRNWQQRNGRQPIRGHIKKAPGVNYHLGL